MKERRVRKIKGVWMVEIPKDYAEWVAIKKGTVAGVRIYGHQGERCLMIQFTEVTSEK